MIATRGLGLQGTLLYLPVAGFGLAASEAEGFTDGQYSLDAYLATEGYADGQYALNAYLATEGYADGLYQLLVGAAAEGYADSQYGIAIYLATEGYLDALYLLDAEVGALLDAVGPWLAHASGRIWTADPATALWLTICSTTTWRADDNC